jgi:hypothetical protein
VSTTQPTSFLASVSDTVDQLVAGVIENGGEPKASYTSVFKKKKSKISYQDPLETCCFYRCFISLLVSCPT